MTEERRDKIIQIRDIIFDNDTVESAIRELISKYLILTHSEGRRLYYQIKSIKHKNSI